MTDRSDLVTLLTFVAVIVLIGAGALMVTLTQPAPVQITIYPPQPTATTPPSATPAPLRVQILGAVQAAGLYWLPVDSRVEDAVQAAGGLTQTADMARVNFADRVRDGVILYIPSIGESAVTLPTPIAGQVIALNSATAADLEALPDIGPALAQRILAYRDANGPFTSLEQLLEVEGIGEATLNTLRPLVVLD